MISFIGDLLIIAGTWALMGQYPKIASMPLALHATLQMLHPLVALLLPLGLILALIGRVSMIISSNHKLRATLYALFLFGRLPLFEGLACIGAFAYLYPYLTATEMSGMIAWIAITLTLGCCLLWIARKVNPQHAR